MTSYLLPDITGSPVGTIKVTLISEFAGLTPTSQQTIERIGMLEAYADVEPGIQQVQTIELDIVDDYTSPNTAGFWFKICTGTAYLKLVLVEDGIDTHYFFGTLQGFGVEWESHYEDGSGAFIRTATITAISMEDVMFNSLTSALVTEIVAQGSLNNHDVPVANYPYKILRLKNVFACLLKSSGLNTTYDADDVAFVVDSSNLDMIFHRGDVPATNYNFNQLFMVTEYYINGDLDIETPVYLGGTGTGTENWVDQFHYVRDLAIAILNSFGLIMRCSYNVANDRHTIELSQRGRAYPDSQLMTFDNLEANQTIINSTFFNDAILVIIGFAGGSVGSATYWASTRDSPTIQSGDPPDWVEVGMTKLTLWRVLQNDLDTYTPQSVYQSLALYASSNDVEGGEDPAFDPGQNVQTMEYYNYTTEATVTPTASNYQLQEALALYFLNLFTGNYRVAISRYFGFTGNNGSTESHTILNPGMRTQINDGLSTLTYFANRVRKLASENAFEVEWHEE